MSCRETFLKYQELKAGRYVIDANAMFFTVMETVRRHAIFSFNGEVDVIVVGIGYSIDNPEKLYDARRSRDLTPKPAKPPISEESLGRPGEIGGGADDFLDFIQKTVKPFIKNEVFQKLQVKQEILLGHSYGGLFTLHTLFTRAEMFDTYIAASPSIWWHDEFIKEEEKAFQAKGGATSKVLRMSSGALEQAPTQHSRESGEEFKKRKKNHDKWKMCSNADELYHRLKGVQLLKSIELKVYPEEDHGSVIGCAVEAGVSSLYLDG